MDGGRVLRALLAARLGHKRGTQIAASVGEGAAILFGMLGLIAGHPILLFIALFVYIAAAAESGVAMMRDALAGRTAADVMITEFVILAPEAPLASAADALLRTSQREFPLPADQGWQVLTRDAIVAALAARGPDAPFLDINLHSVAQIPTRRSRIHTSRSNWC
jgi:stage IV sporulation protein FB